MIARTKFSLLFLAFLAVCCLAVSSIHLAAQAPSPHVPFVSDWTHHRVLFRESKDPAINEKLHRDPGWMHGWYERHPQSKWPGYHRRQPATPASSGNRDWTVPLGAANFAPTFDGSFTFNLCCGNASAPDTGFGSLSAIDLGNGSMLATQGSITLTATADGSYTGSWALYPGGPNNTWSPSYQFHYDNLVYPGAGKLLDGSGLLFANNAGFEANLHANSATNYEYEDYSGMGYREDNTGAAFALAMNASPDPGGNQTYPAKFVFDVTTVPSCTSDYVAMGVAAIPTPGGQANIVGFNNLYTTSGGTGFCGGTGPLVMFAYASGSGQVPAAVTLSTNGKQIAYIENLATSSWLHVLTIGTTGSNGQSATASVVPGSAGGNNAIDQKVLLSPDGGTHHPELHHRRLYRLRQQRGLRHHLQHRYRRLGLPVRNRQYLFE